MSQFDSFGFPEQITRALTEMKFEKATPVQSQAIPPALKGMDILGTAQTGTGKTAAFGLPMLTHLINNPDSVGLILCPTRELATQVMAALRDMMKYADNIRTALLLGGNPMPVQLDQLKRRARLIIGTPGRVNDHIRRNSRIFERADFIVLDEADRMLDMGFMPQLDEILKHVPEKRQTLMFSATMDKQTENFTKKYLVNPVRVAVASEKRTADKIKQEIIHTTASNKYEALVKEIETRPGSIIVFVKTRRNADKLSAELCRAGHESEPIHGDLRQRQRDRAIKGFRNMDYRIMVATDVAARGLDIPHIEHVINFDLPQCPEDYVHRIGRTARAGAEGCAVSLICPSDRGMWSAITRLIDPSAPQPERSERMGMGRSGAGRVRPARSHTPRAEAPFRPSRKPFEGHKKFGDRKPFGEKREFGDRKPFGDRAESGAGKPFSEKRDFGAGKSYADRRPYGDKKEFGEKREFSDRKPYGDRAASGERKPYGDRSASSERKPYAEKREFSDRKPYGDRAASGERKPYGEKREFSDKKPYSDRKPYGDKKEFGDRKPYGDRAPSGDRKPYGEKREFGDKKPYSDRKPYGDRAASGERKPYGDKREFGDKKPYSDRKPYGDRSASGERKPYGEKREFGDKKPYSDRKPAATHSARVESGSKTIRMKNADGTPANSADFPLKKKSNRPEKKPFQFKAHDRSNKK